jgi:hypothetical protein
MPYASTLQNPLLNVISGYEGCAGNPCHRGDWVVRSARSLARLHGCSGRRRSKGLYVDIMTMLCLLTDHLCEKNFRLCPQFEGCLVSNGACSDCYIVSCNRLERAARSRAWWLIQMAPGAQKFHKAARALCPDFTSCSLVMKASNF